MLEGMTSKKYQEARLLEARLKLCKYAYALAVQPTMEAMPRHERIVALKALVHAGKEIPVALMVEHSRFFAQELLRAHTAQEANAAAINEVVDCLSLWRGVTKDFVCEEWTVDRPSFASLLAHTVDSHKLLPADKKSEVVLGDFEA